MSPSEKLDRRIDSSSDLSQYVYDFEKQYTEYMKKGYSEKCEYTSTTNPE